VVKVLQRFLLKFLFGCAKVDPPLEGKSTHIVLVLIHQLLNDLTRAFELLCVPAESGSGHEVLVGGLLLTILHLQDVGVDLFLVYMTAALVIENQCDCGGKLALPPILNLV
jgi:hypothetical protein